MCRGAKTQALHCHWNNSGEAMKVTRVVRIPRKQVWEAEIVIPSIPNKATKWVYANIWKFWITKRTMPSLIRSSNQIVTIRKSEYFSNISKHQWGPIRPIYWLFAPNAPFMLLKQCFIMCNATTKTCDCCENTSMLRLLQINGENGCSLFKNYSLFNLVTKISIR